MEEPKQVRQRRAESPKPQPNPQPQDAAVPVGGSKLDWHWANQIAACDFKKVPIQCNGLALGLCGLAGIFLNLQAFLFGPSAPFTTTSATVAWLLACVALSVAGLNQALYMAKVARDPKSTWQTDFCSVATCAGQTIPLTMGMGSITFARVASSLPGLKAAVAPLAWMGVCGSMVLQVIVMARFYQLVHRERASRSVLFFAPSVSIGLCAVTGGAVGMPGELMALSSWCTVAVMLVLFPVVAWRVIHNADLNNNPGIGLLLAPCAFTTLGWHAAKKTSPTAAAWLGPYIVGDVLFAMSVAGVVATVYCSFVRKQALRSVWFSSPWAAYTFPAASNANAALMQAMARPNPLVFAYAVALSVLAIVLISTINIAHIVHVAEILDLRPKATVSKEKGAKKTT